MIGACPVCDEIFDADGFFEHGVDTLWYCTCGVVSDVKGNIISPELVDLKDGLHNRRGLFINAGRMKQQKAGFIRRLMG